MIFFTGRIVAIICPCIELTWSSSNYSVTTHYFWLQTRQSWQSPLSQFRTWTDNRYNNQWTPSWNYLPRCAYNLIVIIPWWRLLPTNETKCIPLVDNLFWFHILKPHASEQKPFQNPWTFCRFYNSMPTDRLIIQNSKLCLNLWPIFVSFCCETCSIFDGQRMCEK